MKYQWTPNCHWRTISNHYKMFYCIYFRRNSSFTYDLWYHINSSRISLLLWGCKMFVFMWNNSQKHYRRTKNPCADVFSTKSRFFNRLKFVKHYNLLIEIKWHRYSLTLESNWFKSYMIYWYRSSKGYFIQLFSNYNQMQIGLT